MSDEGKADGTRETASEGVSKGLVLGIAAAVAVAAVALGYFFNVVSDQIVGMLVAGAFVLALSLMVLKIGADLAKPALRYGSFALVLGLALVSLYPAKVALHLGHPDASATLTEASNTLKLPSGGAYSLLVSGHLGTSSDARINYRIKAGEESVEGALERQYMTRRARRGASIQVPEDHDLAVHDLRVPGDNPAIVLDRVTTGQQLLVQAYSMMPPALLWALMALVLLLSTWLEAKVPSSGTMVMAGAAAVCFSFIIKSGNPSSMAWTTIWGSLLAVGGGALLGSVLGAIGKRFIKPEVAGPKPRKPKDDDEKAAKPA